MEFSPFTGMHRRRVHSILKCDAELVAVGPAEFAAGLPHVQNQAAELLRHSEVQCVIVPIGRMGQLLWQEVPGQIAMMVAGVRPEALFVLSQAAWRRAFERHPEEMDLYRFLATFGEHTALLPASNLELFDSHFPALVSESQRLTEAEERSLKFLSGPLKAGLAQILGDMDLCHEVAQGLEGKGNPRHADYWHAILHRREPDYGNAKYWFRSVGSHPVFSLLARQAAEVLQSCNDPAAKTWSQRLTNGGWDAFAYVDLCREVAIDNESPLAVAAREIQWAEMLLLLAACAGNEHAK